MIKRVMIFLLAAAFLLCGFAAAESTTLSILVKDGSNSYTELNGVTVTVVNTLNDATVKQVTDESGKVTFPVVISNTYSITAAKDGYTSQNQNILIDETNKISVLYLSMLDPLTLVVKDDNAAHVANAIVTIDSTPAGTTDSSGTLPINIRKGATHTFEITHPLYEPFSEQVNIGAEKSVTLYLTKIVVSPFFYVTAKDGTPLAGASVYLGSSLAGVTGDDGVAKLTSTSFEGSNPITVSKEGYETYTGNVYISTGQTEYDVILYPLMHDISIFINSATTPVAGAVVYIDEKLAAYSAADGNAVPASEYNEGDHTILVTADGYAPLQKTVTINAANKFFAIDLSRTTAPVSIKVVSGDQPMENVPVFIDAKAAGVTDNRGMFSETCEIGKTIQVSAVLEGYTSSTATWMVVNGENNLIITLSRDIPVTIIAIGALGVIVVLLVVILIVTGVRRKRARSGSKSGKGRNERGRDFL